MPEGVTRLGMFGRIGVKWLCSFAHFAGDQSPLLPLQRQLQLA